MDGESEEAEQQERSPDGGATSGSEALCQTPSAQRYCGEVASSQ